MTTLNIGIASIDDMNHRFTDVWNGDKNAGGHYLSFLNWDILHDTLAPNRMAIIHALTGAGEISIRELARRLGRDVRAVHSDVKKLLGQGVIEKSEAGIIFPYDSIHFDFTLGKVQAA